MPPLERRLRDGPVPPRPHDRAHDLVLRLLDDAHEGEGGDGGAVFAEDQARRRAGHAQLEGVRERCAAVVSGVGGGREGGLYGERGGFRYLNVVFGVDAFVACGLTTDRAARVRVYR